MTETAVIRFKLFLLRKQSDVLFVTLRTHCANKVNFGKRNPSCLGQVVQRGNKLFLRLHK